MPHLFVYGTLMPGHAPTCVADLVGRFVPLGRATVGGRLYDLGNYPGLILDLGESPDPVGPAPTAGRGDGGSSSTVGGILVEVPDDPFLLRRLDAYEGFDPAAPDRSLFCRVPAVARLDDGRSIDCQTYVYNRTPPAGRRVPGGDWCRRAGTAAAVPADDEPAPGAEQTHCSAGPAAAAAAAERTHCAVDPAGVARSQPGSGEPTGQTGDGAAAPNEPIAPGPAAARPARPLPSQPQPSQPRRPMRNRPVIGITTDYVDEKPTRYMLPSDYAASVERAGGLPVLLPFRSDLSLIPDYVDLVDGIVFTGGNDLDPTLYGDEPPHPKVVPIEPARQRFELALIAEVERRRTPALGVCLGSQLMNVHRGGSLHQFIPDVLKDGPIEHRHQGDDGYRHEVEVKPGTVLADAIGKAGPLTVNSRHKQAFRTLGRGLRANAVAPDGIVEGFEDPSLPLFLAVQWHPENLTGAHPEHLAPFVRLVKVSAAARG